MRTSLCASTFDPTRITVDYTEPADRRIQFHGAPRETPWRRMGTVWGYWTLWWPARLTMGGGFVWLAAIGGYLQYALLSGMLSVLIALPHLVPAYDAKVRPGITKALVAGPRWHWRARACDIEHPLWVLPGLDNEVLTYRATGEIAQYLDRLDIVPTEGTEMWEARFRFASVPTTGCLDLTWR